MDEALITDFAREAIMLTIKISTPIMLIGLIIGVLISLVQALTQIQEMTLSFVPKMIAIYAGIFFMFPLMVVALQAFMQKIADAIVNGG